MPSSDSALTPVLVLAPNELRFPALDDTFAQPLSRPEEDRVRNAVLALRDGARLLVVSC